MKWVNHVAIGSAITAVWRPELVPVAVLGSTAPDWLEWGLKAVGQHVKHRTTTHYVSAWASALIFGFIAWGYNHALAAFALGGLIHVFCDALTVQGVPMGWWSDRKFHLFGGRLKTGQMGEYWVSGAVIAVCFALGGLTHQWHGGGFRPFFLDWAHYYSDGLIDAKEWRENRFRWL